MAHDVRTSELREPIDVADYLFQRLKEVGVESIHGLPGDYNLVALDYVTKHGLNWVGNCNELNAGYAADGYARIKGVAALVTTFGVGELSAINAIAGAFSEYVPIVHVVGVPSTLSQRNGMLLHHTLGNGDFTVFQKMNSQITVFSASLNDPYEIPTLIDQAIQQCILHSRPVYLTLPTDIVEKKVEGARLQQKLNLDYPPNDETREDYVVEVVLEKLHAAKNPCVLVDGCAIRHRALAETRELVESTGLPTFVAPMGKGSIDETLPNYGGVFAGDGSNEGVEAWVEASDLVLSIGAVKSDFNTAGFTYHLSQLNTIDFHSGSVTIGYAQYPGIRMNGVLRKVSQRLVKDKLVVQPPPKRPSTVLQDGDSEVITQTWFWPYLEKWLQSDDIVITETGTSAFGIWETRFPKGAQSISQVLWGSIGYATGCLQGAALAAKEKKLKRTILFTGDGSFQLTAQELSTCFRNKLNPIVFVINNDGYTIERFIHGMDAGYNDVQQWKYTELVSAFGASKEQAQTYIVKTRKECLDLFADKEFSDPNNPKLRFVEIYMPKEDAPRALKLVADAAAKTNAS